MTKMNRKTDELILTSCYALPPDSKGNNPYFALFDSKNVIISPVKGHFSL